MGRRTRERYGHLRAGHLRSDGHLRNTELEETKTGKVVTLPPGFFADFEARPDRVTLVGGEVDQWNDSTATYAASAPAAANRPPWNATDVDFNNLPSIGHFNPATPKALLIPHSPIWSLGPTGQTTVAVYADPNGGGILVCKWHTGAPGREWIIFGFAGGSINYLVRNSTDTGNNGVVGLSDTSAPGSHLGLVAYDGASAITAQADSDPTQVNTPITVRSDVRNVVIGSFSDIITANAFAGKVQRLVFYDRQLSAQERQRVKAWYNQNYAKSV